MFMELGGYPFSDKHHPEYGTAVAQGLLHVDLRVLHHPLLNLQMSGEPLLFGLTLHFFCVRINHILRDVLEIKNKQTNRQTNKETKEINKQTNKQTNRQTDRQTNKQAKKQSKETSKHSCHGSNCIVAKSLPYRSLHSLPDHSCGQK